LGTGRQRLYSSTHCYHLLTRGTQEGYLAKYAVSEEDRRAAEQARLAGNSRSEDPMQGLEELRVAGPKPE
jgi:hypothetical protein